MRHSDSKVKNKISADIPETRDIQSLSAQEQKIQEQIKKLQEYVEHGPELERAAEEERFSTLPPPAEVKARQREKQFMEKLSRGELKNERRHQTKSGFLLVILVLAIAAVALWIYRVLFL